MEEKLIKIPKRNTNPSYRSFSNNRYSKEDKNSMSNINVISVKNPENNNNQVNTESTEDTNTKKFIYKKNSSRPKGNITLSKNFSQKCEKNNTKIIPHTNRKYSGISSYSNSVLNNNDHYSVNQNQYSNMIIQKHIKIRTSNNQNNNISIITPKNEFINIEDLMLLEEKFNDVIFSINNKNNIFNKSFEFINFYNQSSMYNKFENYFRNINAKLIVHISIMHILFNIILIYHISFNQSIFNICSDYLNILTRMSHSSYLLLCEYISCKISSKAQNNIWVLKLREMLKLNLIHLNLNNKEYVSYLFSHNISLDTINNNDNNFIIQLLYEIKFYTFNMKKYIILLIKNLDTKQSEFFSFYQNLQNRSEDEIYLFFRIHVFRIININASIGFSDASFYENSNLESDNLLIKVPYLDFPSKKKFTLILDLDETLIAFKMDLNEGNKGLLKFRPGLDGFLLSIKQNYEIIVFTSATEEYADPIINEIENSVKYFDFRLYRKHAIISDNSYVKDISRVGRPLDKIIIVDNMPQNYRLQKENGIMIKPFWGEDDFDTALVSLGEILNKIYKEFDDVRKGITFYKNDILNNVSSQISRNENNTIKKE